MIRFRPIMLTALAVVAGATVILTDPFFQGLAIALMTGIWRCSFLPKRFFIQRLPLLTQSLFWRTVPPAQNPKSKNPGAGRRVKVEAEGISRNDLDATTGGGLELCVFELRRSQLLRS